MEREVLEYAAEESGWACGWIRCPRGQNYDEIFVKFGGPRLGWNCEVNFGSAAGEVCKETWNLGTNSTFALGLPKTKENLDQTGQSQDLPDEDWLLDSSEAFRCVRPTSSLFMYGKYVDVDCWQARSQEEELLGVEETFCSHHWKIVWETAQCKHIHWAINIKFSM